MLTRGYAFVVEPSKITMVTNVIITCRMAIIVIILTNICLTTTN